MGGEVEAAAADSVAGFLRRQPKHALPAGTPCPNCRTLLEGPFCHACGQSADDFHRSIWKLVVEAVQGMVEYDGRVWRTLPNLFLNPGRLTRDFLDGHRAPQVPPFRLFLVVVVLVFLAGEGGPKVNTNYVIQGRDAEAVASVHTGPSQGMAVGIASATESELGPTFGPIVKRALSRPDAFQASLSTWAHRLAILALPLGAGLLSLVFVGRRGVYGFDHLIFAMHSLSFQGLWLSGVMLLGRATPLAGWLMLAAPVHLFFHLRGVYRTGVLGTVLREAAILFGGLVGALVIVLALVAIGLYEVGAA